MSEQYPDEYREVPSPGYFECDRCEEVVETTWDNTAYFVFEKEPWNNHVRTMCEDGFFTAMPIDTNDIDQLEFANQFKRIPFEFLTDLNTEKRRYGDEMQEMLDEFKGVPPTYELTQGMEERLAHFREVLENAPPGFIVAELVEVPMPPKRYKDKWI